MPRGRGKIVLVSAVLLVGLAGALLFRGRPGADAEPATAGPHDSTTERAPAPAAAPAALGRIELGEPAEDSQPAASLDTAWAPEDEPARASAAGSAGPAHAHPFGMSAWQAAEAARGDEPPAGPGSSFARHTVRDGDTLSAIARRYLGASERFLEIFEANRHRLASPDLLPIGLELDIPLAGTAAEPSEPAAQRHSVAAGEMVAIPPGSLVRGQGSGDKGTGDRGQE